MPMPRLLFLKSHNISEPLDELIQEHARLVAVLRSPDHRDDQREARRQADELRKYRRKRRKAQQQTAVGAKTDD